MWRCTNCGQEQPDDKETCWVCTKPRNGSHTNVDKSRGSQPTQYLAGRNSQSSSLATQLGIAGLNNRTVIAVGIVIAVIGVALIIISSNLLLILHPQLQREAEAIVALQGPIMFFGVILLIVGGIISAVGFSKFISARPTTPPAQTTQPVATQSVSPKSVELGNTPGEVQSVMGQPDKIIDLGARVIHIYKDMKIIYVDGKVSDVQL